MKNKYKNINNKKPMKKPNNQENVPPKKIQKLKETTPKKSFFFNPTCGQTEDKGQNLLLLKLDSVYHQDHNVFLQ